MKENRKLKLANVIVKELRGVGFQEFENEILKFVNFIETSNIQTRGPLVTRLRGSKIYNESEFFFDYDIMVQAVRQVKLPNLKFKKNFTVDNCLYVHFEGKNDDFNFVQSKLDLHIWENNLISTGQEITVHLESSGECMSVDVFRPMEKFNETL